MKKPRTPNNPDAQKRAKKANSRSARNADPFAIPPHPLGYRFLSEERPLRATKFNAILPSVISRYGLGRKLVVERFQNAWRKALEVVFVDDSYAQYDFSDPYEERGVSKLDFYLRHARLVSFRGGTAYVEIASNLLYQELQFYLGSILNELRRLLPEDKIEKIKLVVR